jgi:Fe-S-cluster containining protein
MSLADEATCQACGACCAYSAEWPRFGLETEQQIEAIPREYVDDARGTIRCDGDRCIALQGDVGVATACSLYAVRPEVCRACLPGDDSCLTARRRFNLPPIASAAPR